MAAFGGKEPLRRDVPAASFRSRLREIACQPDMLSERR
jgi:hypothetical protein